MTEQSKIPLPHTSPVSAGEQGPKNPSLLERVSGEFGLGDFKPAAVPKDLALPAKRRAVKPAQDQGTDQQAAPAAAVPEPAQPAVPAPVITPAATAQPHPEPEPAPAPAPEPVHFSGTRHHVDRQLLRKQGLIDPEGSVTALMEEFRIVKRQLLAASGARGGSRSARDQRVLICSPLPGEGKTFCATNLALAIAAEKDREVLLVDADFAKPSILSALGLPGGPGLMDALSDPSLAVEDCVIGTDIPGLWVLPAGNQSAQDSEFLSSDRTAHILDRLTQGAPNRMVIFDSPPALAASPAAELAQYVGQALLIVRADSTGQSALEDALSLLSTCPDIKLLLNAAHFSPSGRRFGTYYGYGENHAA